jgi:hypothetical protein
MPRKRRLAADAAEACAEVFSTPELRDLILDFSMKTHKTPTASPKIFKTFGSRDALREYGLLPQVCKEWGTAVKGTPDKLRELLTPLTIPGRARPFGGVISVPGIGRAIRKKDLMSALCLSHAKIKPYATHLGQSSDSDSDSDDEEHQTVAQREEIYKFPESFDAALEGHGGWPGVCKRARANAIRAIATAKTKAIKEAERRAEARRNSVRRFAVAIDLANKAVEAVRTEEASQEDAPEMSTSDAFLLVDSRGGKLQELLNEMAEAVMRSAEAVLAT